MSNNKSNSIVLSIVTIVISLLALGISGLSYSQSLSSHKDISGAETIGRQYGFYYEFSRMEVENWQIGHIFALPDWYNESVRQISSSLKSTEPTKRAELLLKERAIARFILTNYEEIFYQWKHAKSVGDTQRAGFLEEVLNYFTGRLLRNPRLLYYWSEDGGKLAADFEPETRKHYEEHVLRNYNLPLTQKPDPLGPFSQEPVNKGNLSRKSK